MDHSVQHHNGMPEDDNKEPKKKQHIRSAVIFSATIIFVSIFASAAGVQVKTKSNKEGTGVSTTTSTVQSSEIVLRDKIIPKNGVVLPIKFGDLGATLVSVGVIDWQKFEAVYAGRGGLSEESKKLLGGTNTGNLKITQENAPFLLNLFWALGLGNKNPILEQGPMTDPRYKGAGNFASTGGWSLARGNPMDHYSKHTLISLTVREQALVERVSKGIYRPCCDNPTYFPDCNHGMAMLGLLELMASQGVSEEEMYRTALRVNAYWFPDTYLTIAKYLESKGGSWEVVDPKEILGINYSSASGYQKILSQMKGTGSGGASCGV